MFKDGDILRAIVLGVIVIIVSYGIARGVFFAYFRSRFEHFRRLIKAMKEGEK